MLGSKYCVVLRVELELWRENNVDVRLKLQLLNNCVVAEILCCRGIFEALKVR